MWPLTFGALHALVTFPFCWGKQERKITKAIKRHSYKWDTKLRLFALQEHRIFFFPPLVFTRLIGRCKKFTSSRLVTRRTRFRCSDVRAPWVNQGGIRAEEKLLPLSPLLPSPPTSSLLLPILPSLTYRYQHSCGGVDIRLAIHLSHRQQHVCFREWKTTNNRWTHCFHFSRRLRRPGRPRRNSGAPSVFSVNKTCWENKIPSMGV